MIENTQYLTEQIITYIGNKRSLLSFIGESIDLVKKEIKKEKLDTFDVFSGSGIVSRYLKQFSKKLYTNDLEDYAKTINQCYLTNQSDIDFAQLDYWYNYLISHLKETELIKTGFISKMYSPFDDENIQPGERVFFTTRNAQFIDTERQLLNTLPEPYKTLFLGPLLYEASTKNNTSGVFKGFYKNSETHLGQFGGNGRNALTRILANIEVKKPIFSNFDCDVTILQGDANTIVSQVPKIDLAYLDPPYNQHPYSSNYFMLNLINNYETPVSVSNISGIPTDWNKSQYNKKSEALSSLSELCEKIQAHYLLISFNSEGFISFDEMVSMLQHMGTVQTFDKKYNVFRGCRNLQNRDPHLKEFLFLLNKES